MNLERFGKSSISKSTGFSAPPTRTTRKTSTGCLKSARRTDIIYKGTYTGLYAVVSESFVNDAKPGDIDPETGKPYEELTEENYFFKLSAFTEPLLKFYDDNPDFIQPEIRRNEVLAFVKQGLADLSITRTSIKWGIPVESDPAHVFYVWFDALIDVLERGRWRRALAGGSAPDRQRNSALPRGVLAGVPDGGGLAAAEESIRARLAVV